MREDFADLLDDDDTDLFLGLAKDKHKRKRQGRTRSAQWIGCPLPWFIRTIKKTRTHRQLVMMMLLYRRCCLAKSSTITVPAEGIDAPDLDRFAKSKILRQLSLLGLIKLKSRPGRSARITVAGWRITPE